MQEESSLRIVFAGTPAFAAEHLATLWDSEHEIVAVYTQPDRPAGRGKKLRPSPVKKLAREHGLPVHQPTSLRDPGAREALTSLKPDVMVVVAYGLILPQAVLDIPRHGCLNVHASLLPRWRGAAPIQRAIEAGDRETGVTIMQMDAGLDTGPMLASARCEIGDRDTAATLLERLANLGQCALLGVLSDLVRGQVTALPQDDSKATYAAKIDKQEAAIDWREEAITIDRKIRAFNPFPVAFARFGGQRVKIYRAEPIAEVDDGSIIVGTIISSGRSGVRVRCGKGSLQIEELQLPGKRAMPVNDLLLGNRDLFPAGERFE